MGYTILVTGSSGYLVPERKVRVLNKIKIKTEKSENNNPKKAEGRLPVPVF